MKYTRSTIRFDKGEIETFHYKYSDLKRFLKFGFKHGDVGMILIKREGELKTYKGFGTIESPIKFLHTMSIVSHPLFDNGPTLPPLKFRVMIIDPS